MGKPDALSRRADHGTGSSDNENLVLLKPELFTIRALEGIVLEGEERGGTFSTRSVRVIVKDVMRIQLLLLRASYVRVKGSQSSQLNGHRAMDSSSSGARSMFQMTRSYVVALSHITMIH